MNKLIFKSLLIVTLFGLSTAAYGILAGGRPNSFSEGNNAFAGVVNPANAVWIADRLDVGAFLVLQKATLDNRDNNPLFPPGKINFAYKSKNLFTTDIGIHKQVQLKLGPKVFDSSFSLATYTVPGVVKSRTKQPLQLAGTTPLVVQKKTEVISAVFSFKLNKCHSLGFTIDYLYFSLRRDGFQNSDNALRSVSPGNVTNNGTDHSSGVGFSLGWRWNITKKLAFGTAWVKKSYCGQFKKYSGFEPYHAKNYIPQTLGGGFSYRFTPKMAGRLEVLWSNLGNLPGSNNGILPDGKPNLNKRGSNKSPGPGLSDATYINIGLGYKLNEMLSLGAGYSHRIKLPRKHSNISSHSYMLQTIYDTLSLGANIKYKKHDLFLVFSQGFRNKVSGSISANLGGGRLIGEKQTTSFSISWGYMY